MSDTVIKVENLSKQYRIGAKEGYRTFRETLVDAAKAPIQGIQKLFNSKSKIQNSKLETIWALKDVSFEVKRGEVVGIIGRNGAGKSTLLKILSRITEPTKGRVELRGRVGSLLEVGTGFHPELTGHENIYLYGAILGMDRWEVSRKFDEIVAFAELEKFIDTPVKRYSSGMYMRLAFAVAAHLESEILLVDEVLAVGDAAFQKKCLGKMGDVSKKGRTVLFVSHNIGSIQRLCSSVILIEQGELNNSGSPIEVTEFYLQSYASSVLCWERSSSPNNPTFIQKIYVCDLRGNQLDHLTTASSFAVVIEFFIVRHCPALQLSVGLLDFNGDQIFGSSPQDADVSPPNVAGQYRATMYFPSEILLAKTYGIKVTLWQLPGGIIDSVDSLRFSVQEAASLTNKTPGGRAGLLVLQCNWKIELQDG